VDLSDISQVFDVDDIMILAGDITASERRGFGEKYGYFLLGFEFSFLIEIYTFGTPHFISISK